MITVPYFDYRKMKDFYTIEEISRLFGMTRFELTETCKQYCVALEYNSFCELRLSKEAVRGLHYQLYHETHRNRSNSRRRVHA
ncbi:hypothetical protein D3Z52_11895 [Clostridiaceae bacterium]|nr:hypothetical protein [Clostridiaceae bacterium]NBI83614.1 hypothetical protein [Clostridiaceae bacterium]